MEIFFRPYDNAALIAAFLNATLNNTPVPFLDIVAMLGCFERFKKQLSSNNKSIDDIQNVSVTYAKDGESLILKIEFNQ